MEGFVHRSKSEDGRIFRGWISTPKTLPEVSSNSRVSGYWSKRRRVKAIRREAQKEEERKGGSGRSIDTNTGILDGRTSNTELN